MRCPEQNILILLSSMVKKQEYEGGWCGYKVCFNEQLLDA